MKKVQQHYDDVAEIYDDRYDRDQGRYYHAHIREIVASRLPKGGFLLDLGCGTGLFVRQYVADGGRAIGLDISPKMVAKGKQHYPESEFVVGTADVLPFCDGTFDAVASLLAFSYVPRPAAMLDEVYRILRPGGSLALCTLGHNVFTSAVPIIYQVGEKVGLKKVGVGDFDEHYYDEAEICELLEKAGFADISTKRCSFAHLALRGPLFRAAKMVEPFVEENIPYLAYNLCASAKKPER